MTKENRNIWRKFEKLCDKCVHAQQDFTLVRNFFQEDIRSKTCFMRMSKSVLYKWLNGLGV